MSEVALFNHEAGRYFIFIVLEFIAHFIRMRQVFLSVFVLFVNCELDETDTN